MKIIIILVAIVQIVGISLFFVPAKIVHAFHSNAYSYDAEVSPEFFNIAPCPSCATPSYASVSGGASPYAGASTAPNVAVTSSAQAPSMAPCKTDSSVATDNARHGKHHKKHKGGISNFMQQILKFFLQLI